MDDVLKSEVFIVVYEKEEGVPLEEFGALFRQVHGYFFKLSNYGYSSLKALLNDMKDVVELKTVNGQDLITCKSSSRDHLEVSNGSSSFPAQGQIFGIAPLPSSAPSPGSVVKKHEQAQCTPLQQNPVKQVNSTNSATGKKSKEKSKHKCSVPAQNSDPAVSHRNSTQPINCGFSLNKKSATQNETTKQHTSSATLKPLTSNPVHAKPARNAAIVAGAAKTSNISKTTCNSDSKSLHPKSERSLTPMQNVRIPNTMILERQTFSATIGPGIQPNVSYASVCANNSRFNHHGQQPTPSNLRFNVGTKVNAASVTQSYSRTEPRISLQSSAIIKENIQGLLNQYANGLSVFQLQKLYLFMFRQPLKFKGPTTMKQLFLELKDVVKTEGVGVQMLVFPVHAENNTTTAHNGDHDSSLQAACSLFIAKDAQKEIVLNLHSSDSVKTQNFKTQKVAQLPLHDDQSLASGHQDNADYVQPSREQLFVPASDVKVLPKHINEKPQHKAPSSAQTHDQIHQIHGEEKVSNLCQNVILKEATTKIGFLQNGPQNSSSPQIILHSSGFSYVMEQQINGPRNEVNEVIVAGATSSLIEEKASYYTRNMLQGPEHSQQLLSSAHSGMLSQDTKPHQLPDLHVKHTDHLFLPPQNLMKTYRQTKSPALQPKGDFQTANNCNITEHPPSHSKDCLQTKTALLQIEKPSSIQKPNSQNTQKVEQSAYSSSQERAPDSQVINDVNILSNSSSNEKTSHVQTKNDTEKTSQQEASVSPSTNDLGRASGYDVYVHGAEPAAPMSSDVHKAVDIHASSRTINKSILPTKPLDEVTAADGITQTNLISLKPREEIVDPSQNTTKQPKISAAQSELQDNLESTSDLNETSTWQTGQAQICSIL